MVSTIHQEDIHISYITALCASADITYEKQQHDDDSTDGIIKKRITLSNGGFYDSQLRIQLKSTSSSALYSEDNDMIYYKLKVKNYNDLCTPSVTPVILGLLILPEDSNDWVKWSPKELLIKGRMYWAEFSSAPKTENQSTITVNIPKINIVNQHFLLGALEKIATEEWP